MNDQGIIIIGGKEYHIQALWLEIFKAGLNAHPSWKDKDDADLQAIFEYWLKEKTNTL